MYSALEHIKQHGEVHVPYQKTQLKSMVHAIYPHISHAIYRDVLAQCAVLTQCPLVVLKNLLASHLN